MKELTHYRLAIVGVTIDNEELLLIILRGLPSVTIAIILEEIHVFLSSLEQ